MIRIPLSQIKVDFKGHKTSLTSFFWFDKKMYFLYFVQKSSSCTKERKLSFDRKSVHGKILWCRQIFWLRRQPRSVTLTFVLRNFLRPAFEKVSSGPANMSPVSPVVRNHLWGLFLNVKVPKSNNNEKSATILKDRSCKICHILHNLYTTSTDRHMKNSFNFNAVGESWCLR